MPLQAMSVAVEARPSPSHGKPVAPCRLMQACLDTRGVDHESVREEGVGAEDAEGTLRGIASAAVIFMSPS